ncbi:MAG: hypothetical protein ACRDXC_09930, partial [Acidimicrobiales bacterium]
LGALSPPIGVLIAVGAGLAWDRRRAPSARVVAAGMVLGSAAYAWWLMPSAGTGVAGWIGPAAFSLGVLGAAGVIVTLARAQGLLRTTSIAALGALGVLAVGGVLVPAVASATIVANNLGAFDTPFQPVAATRFLDAFFGAPLDVVALVPRLEKVRKGAPYLMAVQSSVLASAFVFATGQEVLPLGGYTGTQPEPPLRELAHMVARGDFHLVLAPGGSRLPQVVWISRHCLGLRTTEATSVLGPLRAFYCEPSSAP